MLRTPQPRPLPESQTWPRPLRLQEPLPESQTWPEPRLLLLCRPLHAFSRSGHAFSSSGLHRHRTRTRPDQHHTEVALGHEEDDLLKIVLPYEQGW